MYDGFNRLLKSDSLSGITTYSYDPAGNRTRLEEPSGDLTTYTWNAENHLVQTELPSGDVVTTVWNPINKNAEERIVRRDDGTTVTTYLWDNNNILRETDDVGAVEAEYTYIPQPYGDLVSQRREAESHFYQFDALGSTTGLTDETGAVTDEYRYKAFGETVAQTGSTENPNQWVAREGYRKDKATGLLNLRGRDYDPPTAQFTSADPLGLEAGDSNFYRYAGNDPVKRSDPNGLDLQAKFNVKNGYLFITNAENRRLDGFVAVPAGWAGPDIYARTATDGKLYCATFSQIVIALRSGQIESASDWGAWFQENGFDCLTGPVKKPKPVPKPQVAAPIPGESTCQREPLIPGIEDRFLVPKLNQPNSRCTLSVGRCEGSAMSKADKDEFVGEIDELVKSLLSGGADLLPLINTLKGAQEALGGTNPITGDELGVLERIVAAISALIPAAGAAKKLAGPVRAALKSLLDRLARLADCLGPRAKKLREQIQELLVRLLKDEQGTIGFGGGNANGLRPAPALPKFVKGGKTSGVLRIGADDIPLISGKPGPGGALPKPAPGFNAITSTHVEGHAAAYMRQHGIGEATLYINNPVICLPCRQNIEHMLPCGSTLRIILPDGTSVIYIGNAR